ncbi:hypothetical protein [Pandoraea sp. PE-S2R-1]|uniref:hypothetical protein n=1 Tax=Pandoraea sp. PE-S2R-1 TaxID=1986994 RepID=UPI0011307EE0|nr:hypothetical protein [Pandoraea sp. PE-S2R-1]
MTTSSLVFRWLIPAVDGRSAAEIEALTEMARQLSLPRIKRYSGYAFVASFFAPLILYAIGYIQWAAAFPLEMSAILSGLAGLLSVLSYRVLTAVFDALILKPAIHDLLDVSRSAKTPRC